MGPAAETAKGIKGREDEGRGWRKIGVCVLSSENADACSCGHVCTRVCVPLSVRAHVAIAVLMALFCFLLLLLFYIYIRDARNVAARDLLTPIHTPWEHARTQCPRASLANLASRWEANSIAVPCVSRSPYPRPRLLARRRCRIYLSSSAAHPTPTQYPRSCCNHLPLPHHIVLPAHLSVWAIYTDSARTHPRSRVFACTACVRVCVCVPACLCGFELVRLVVIYRTRRLKVRHQEVDRIRQKKSTGSPLEFTSTIWVFLFLGFWWWFRGRGGISHLPVEIIMEQKSSKC